MIYMTAHNSVASSIMVAGRGSELSIYRSMQGRPGTCRFRVLGQVGNLHIANCMLCFSQKCRFSPSFHLKVPCMS